MRQLAHFFHQPANLARLDRALSSVFIASGVLTLVGYAGLAVYCGTPFLKPSQHAWATWLVMSLTKIFILSSVFLFGVMMQRVRVNPPRMV